METGYDIHVKNRKARINGDRLHALLTLLALTIAFALLRFVNLYPLWQ